MYRVNESGAPEMFKASNGNQYLLPSSSGQVTPAGDWGGNQVSIVVNNNMPGADVKTTQSEDGRVIEIAVNRAVDVVAQGIRSNTGPVANALRTSTNATFKTG